MGRYARKTIADVPYHVINRGNNHQPLFFCDDDYLFFLTSAANRLSTMTDPRGFFATSYTYDEAGNLKTLTFNPGNKTVSYTYDELNRLKTVNIDWLLNQTAIYYYDDAGRLYSLTNFNGSVTTYGYDDADRLMSLENKTSGASPSVIARYQFLDLDGNGNRRQLSQNEQYVTALSTGLTTYTYNPPQNNRLMSFSGGSFNYDNEGQLSSGYSPSYTFDYEHRLTAIGSVSQFAYDGSGNRIQAVRSGVTTRYIYDAAGNLLAEADVNNNITRYYIYGKGLMAMMTPANQTYCYHFNATGSTIALTNASQVVVNKYAYDPFGNILSQLENIGSQDTRLQNQPFKFVGQFGVMTEQNGFYYMRARYYDPQVGRFISEDPIGFDGGDVNLMAYVGNNPVMGVDPWGKTGQEIEMAIKMGLPLLFNYLEISTDLPKKWGPVGDVLEAASGVSGLWTAELLLKTAPSLSRAFPLVGAAVSAVDLGLTFNNVYEKISGQPLGADIYDWKHPQTQTTGGRCSGR